MGPNLAAGFNPQVYISILQARRAAGLAMCSSAAQPQTKAVRPQGRATRPTGADAAKQVIASCGTTTRPLGRSSTTKGSNRLPQAGGPQKQKGPKPKFRAF
ncbi:hypothetical protein SGRA_1457 [Saprospira grandis str. Lewin]|uniref:Uncharacterized protein n=1 Tax=Saprospira grandis (strain Lewin) TaxID=984262 RepID=H6L7X1_SAPGL|nr:hypothetical protein SGRA_1457 [Saprospira grandis str. Lewin]